MEETDKKNEESRNLDISFRYSFGNVSDPFDSDEESYLSVVVTNKTFKTSDSSVFQRDDHILHDKDKEVKEADESCRKSYDTSGNNNRADDSCSINVTDASHPSGHYFEEENNNTKNVIKLYSYVEPWQMSDFMFFNSRETEASSSDWEEDSSSDCNSQTSTTAVFSDSDSNASSSYLNNSETDSNVFSTTVLTKQSSEGFTSLVSTEDEKECIRLASESRNVSNTLPDYNPSKIDPNAFEDAKISDTNSETKRLDLNLLYSESKISNSNLKYSYSDQESKTDKRSHIAFKRPENVINTFFEIQDLFHKIIDNAFSDTKQTLDNNQANVVSIDAETKNEAVSNFTKTEYVYDDLKAPVCSEYRTTATQNYPSSDSVSSKSSISACSHETKENEVSSTSMNNNDWNRSESLKYSTSIPSKAAKVSRNVSETCYTNLLLSDTDHESNTGKQSTDSIEIISKDKNRIKTSANLIISNEEETSKNSRETNINEKRFTPISPESAFKIRRCFSRSQTQKISKESESNRIPSDRDSERYQSDLKFSNGDQSSSTSKKRKFSRDEKILQKIQNLEEEVRRKDAEYSVRFSAVNSSQATSIGSVETNDNDPDTLTDIFTTVVRCHPIKKFEIPPYESIHAESSSEEHFTKHTFNARQLCDIDDSRNILESISDIDSHSVMVYDVTDCFSQNSKIICDCLIKEYLDISSKVNYLLIKQVRDISTEIYELRIRSLLSLDDELGYLSAKLITTIRDWVKQFHEIEQNTQSVIGSRGLHHMGILKICLQIAFILLHFILEKQTKLDDYETSLICDRKRN